MIKQTQGNAVRVHLLYKGRSLLPEASPSTFLLVGCLLCCLGRSLPDQADTGNYSRAAREAGNRRLQTQNERDFNVYNGARGQTLSNAGSCCGRCCATERQPKPLASAHGPDRSALSHSSTLMLYLLFQLTPWAYIKIG